MSSGVAQGQIDSISPKNEREASGQDRSSPRFISSLLTIAGGQLGCAAVAALAELCFARLLGPAPRGLISLCLMAVAFGALLGSLGSEATVVLWISKSKGNHTSWFPAVTLWVVSGCVLALFVWL